MGEPSVVLKKVSKCYTKEIFILKDIDLSVDEGEIVLISGHSGCGKTTLLNMIGGLDTPSSGRIFVGDSDITRLSENGLAKVRLHHIGFVFQSYNLIRDMTVAENVALPRRLAGLEHGPRVKYLLGRFGLSQLARKYPSQISGGEAQRVAIARALSNEPRVVLADEPTGNLDKDSSRKVMETFKMLNDEFDTTLIIVSHEQGMESWVDTHYTIDEQRLERH